MKPHPLSQITPPLSIDEELALEASLLKSGQIEDITTLDGMILNGNHRYKLLVKNGIKPRLKEWKPNGVATAEDFVLAMLQGRNLTQGQKSCIAALRHENENPGKAPHRDYSGLTPKEKWKQKHYNRKYVQIAKEMGVSSTCVSYALTMLRHGREFFDRVYLHGEPIGSVYNKYRKAHGTSSRKPKRDRSRWNIEAMTDIIKIPLCYDSREEIDKFIVSMNQHGWMLEMRFKDGKIYANWFGNGFPPTATWMDVHPEFDFKRAVVVAANDKKSKIMKVNK